MTQDSTTRAYSRFPLFQDLDEQTAQRIVAAGYRFTYPAGTPIVVNDDQGETFFLLLSGLAKISVKNAQGNEVNVTLLRPGDFFGEFSLLEKEPARAANVITTADTEVVAFHKKVFLPMVNEHPVLGLNLARVMGHRLRAMNERLTSAQLPEEHRIAQRLLHLAGRDAAEDGSIQMPNLPLKDWVLFCDTSRESFLATMEKLRAMGALAWQNQNIVIKDVNIVTRMASTPHDENCSLP